MKRAGSRPGWFASAGSGLVRNSGVRVAAGVTVVAVLGVAGGFGLAAPAHAEARPDERNEAPAEAYSAPEPQAYVPRDPEPAAVDEPIVDDFELDLSSEDFPEPAYDAYEPAGEELAAVESQRQPEPEYQEPAYETPYQQEADSWPASEEPSLELAWTIARRRREARDFPGHSRILRELEEGPSRRRVGLGIEGRQPVRDGAEITAPNGSVVGRVTSGGFGPSVGGPVAMGYVAAPFAAEGTELRAAVRDKSVPVAVVPLPFYRTRYLKA